MRESPPEISRAAFDAPHNPELLFNHRFFQCQLKIATISSSALKASLPNKTLSSLRQRPAGCKPPSPKLIQTRLGGRRLNALNRIAVAMLACSS